MADVTATALEETLADHFETDVSVRDLHEHVEGWSRDTVSFRATWRGAAGERERRFVVRAESDEQIEGGEGSPGNDIETEYRTMAAVQDAPVPVPETICWEGDRHVLGGKFFIVGHRPGDAPIVWERDDRERLYEHWDGVSDLPDQFVDAAAGIHDLGPSDVPILDAHEDYVDWEIDRWVRVYRKSMSRREPAIEEIIRWFRANKPEIPEHTLVHGDFRIGNMLVDDGDLSAVLDWELARIGDPMYDLGYAATRYFSGKLITAIERPELASALLPREWFYEAYERRTGRSVDRERVRYWRAFAAFTMMTISLSRLHEFETGRADDVRSAWLQYTVPGLIEDQLAIVREDRT
jgi:aminoglycoside phosphotransferase (APT) family kinase protein